MEQNAVEGFSYSRSPNTFLPELCDRCRVAACFTESREDSQGEMKRFYLEVTHRYQKREIL